MCNARPAAILALRQGQRLRWSQQAVPDLLLSSCGETMRTLATPFLFTAFFMAFGSGVCRAQAQQFVLDTIGDGMEGVVGTEVTSTTDGGTIMHLVTDFGESGFQWKLDAVGEPVWSKRYSISSRRRAQMPDGGVVFCEVTGYAPDGDTSHIHLQIVRTDAQGEVIWSKLLTSHDSYVQLFNNGWLRIATDAEGNSLISMSEVGSSAYQWFYCMDPDGELLWSRNFLFNPNADHVEHICSDGFGGWYFGSYDWGASVFRLGRLNTFGDMAWYKSYTVTGPEFWLGGMCSWGFQPVAVGGYDAVADDGDYRWFVMRLKLNGTLDWFRVSATFQNTLSRCAATSAGDLLVSRRVNSLWRLSASGEVIGSIEAAEHTVAGLIYESSFYDWDNLDTTLTLGGLLEAHNEDFSELSYRPAVWRLPIADLSVCGAENPELSSVLASNSNVAVQDQPFSEVVVPVTITDTICTVTSFTPIGVSDYCYYFTGVPHVTQAAALGRVLTTLLVPGEPITAMAPAARCGITVHDAQGSILYRAALVPNENERIPTSAWVPGLYFVRFQPENGGRSNVVKVVFQ